MTVYEIGKNKLRINLTDTEVLSCFGAYERLYSMSYSVQLAINLLLRDIISEHKALFQNGRISAGIKVLKNRGCEITLSALKSARCSVAKEYTFYFADSESLTKAIICLFGKTAARNLKSSLYKIPEGYCLIIESYDLSQLFILNEFCFKKSDSPLKAEQVREQGTPLIINNAINRYGAAFSRI